jgi:hypothetical protein
MKIMSYVFGRVLSSEINRSLARSEANQAKVNKFKQDFAAGKNASQALIEWAKVNPDHPLLERYAARPLRLTRISSSTTSRG